MARYHQLRNFRVRNSHRRTRNNLSHNKCSSGPYTAQATVWSGPPRRLRGHIIRSSKVHDLRPLVPQVVLPGFLWDRALRTLSYRIYFACFLTQFQSLESTRHPSGRYVQIRANRFSDRRAKGRAFREKETIARYFGYAALGVLLVVALIGAYFLGK